MLAFSAMAAAIWDLESAFAIVQLVFSCWFCLCSSVLRLGRIKTVHCDAARRKTLKNQRILRVWRQSPPAPGPLMVARHRPSHRPKDQKYPRTKYPNIRSVLGSLGTLGPWVFEF